MNVGDTFFNINVGTLNHLWVVIARSNDGQLAIVNLTTRRDDSDETCLISQGEHPFVKHDTAVHYSMGQLVEESVLETLQEHKHLQMRVPASSELLHRIQQGALDSKFTKQAIQELVRKALQ